MTNQIANRELAAAQRRVMRAWNRLEDKRDSLIEGLRTVQADMEALDPVICAVLRGRLQHEQRTSYSTSAS